MEKEIWKDVEGWEGIYAISNLGRLKSFKKYPEGYIMKMTNETGWYFSVVLCQGDRSESTRIHRLVAKHFIPNPENKKTVNHKDLNKQNNIASNLEWATQKENNAHAGENLPHKNDGMINYNQNVKTTPIHQFSINGDFIAEYKNGKEASDSTGVCHRNIMQVAAKTEYKPGLTRKQAGGFIWKFKNK